MSKILVGIRVKPDNTESNIVAIDSDDNTLSIKDRKFKFDRVFPQYCSQDEVFEFCEACVAGSAKGFDTSILMYGATGSGKTTTMIGLNCEEKLQNRNAINSVIPSEWGILPRCIETLFAELSQISPPECGGFSVSCSYMQVYNDKIYDLLSTKSSRKNPLRIREMNQSTIDGVESRSTVVVEGLSVHNGVSPADFLRLLDIGNKGRATRSTNSNEFSSRSHAIFQLNIIAHVPSDDLLEPESLSPNSADSDTIESRPGSTESRYEKRIAVSSRVSLVDLAGSEKWDNSSKPSLAKQLLLSPASLTCSYAMPLEMQYSDVTSSMEFNSENQKSSHSQASIVENEKRLTEMFHINSSLSCLGNCINALSDTNRSHIPYRDNLLTRVLQNSLEGHGRLIIISTICPLMSSIEETLSTLAFASRASTVVMTKIRRNELLSPRQQLKNAQEEIRRLRVEMQQLQQSKSALELSFNYGARNQSRCGSRQTLRSESSKFLPPLVPTSPTSSPTRTNTTNGEYSLKTTNLTPRSGRAEWVPPDSSKLRIRNRSASPVVVTNRKPFSNNSSPYAMRCDPIVRKRQLSEPPKPRQVSKKSNVTDSARKPPVPKVIKRESLSARSPIIEKPHIQQQRRVVKVKPLPKPTVKPIVKKVVKPLPKPNPRIVQKPSTPIVTSLASANGSAKITATITATISSAAAASTNTLYEFQQNESPQSFEDERHGSTNSEMCGHGLTNCVLCFSRDRRSGLSPMPHFAALPAISSPCSSYASQPTRNDDMYDNSNNYNYETNGNPFTNQRNNASTSNYRNYNSSVLSYASPSDRFARESFGSSSNYGNLKVDIADHSGFSSQKFTSAMPVLNSGIISPTQTKSDKPCEKHKLVSCFLCAIRSGVSVDSAVASWSSVKSIEPVSVRSSNNTQRLDYYQESTNKQVRFNDADSYTDNASSGTQDYSNYYQTADSPKLPRKQKPDTSSESTTPMRLSYSVQQAVRRFSVPQPILDAEQQFKPKLTQPSSARAISSDSKDDPLAMAQRAIMAAKNVLSDV